MTRTSRFALFASAIAVSFAAGLAAGAPANAAGVSVPSVTIDPVTQRLAVQTITTDVRGYNPVVHVSAPLAQFVWTVQLQGSEAALPGDCVSGGSGAWNCLGNLEATGKITISYLFNGTPPPGTYTVSASMGDNGVT